MSEAQFEEREDEIAHLLVRVYEIHEIIIAETGGLPGLRDGAMLHAAVARPFATFDGQELYPSDLEKAGALFHSPIKICDRHDAGSQRAIRLWTELNALLFRLRCSFLRVAVTLCQLATHSMK